jgi:hypothetical protein
LHFCRTEKILEFATKRNSISSIAFIVFCAAAQRNIWNLPTTETQLECILFSRVAKDLEFANQGDSNSLRFVLPRS